MPLLLKEGDEALDGFGRRPRGNLGGDTAETGAVGVHAAADHDEVLRHGALAEAADAALEADRGNGMLAAPVRAAADLDVARTGGIGDLGARAQVLAEQVAEAARLRHRDPAGLRARAAGDVGNRDLALTGE